MIRWWLLLGRS